MVDLRTDDGLRRACESVDFDSEKTRTFVEEVANASRKCFFSEKYQKRLWRWRCNPICFAGGQAPQVEVHRLIQDDGFLDWFYAKYDEIRSLESQDRTEPLCEFKNRLLERVTRFSSIPPKRPKLVTYRALAALFPENFTCLASEGELCRLAKNMDIDIRGDSVVVRHRKILDRLEEVLGPVRSGDWDNVSRRLRLPWALRERIQQENSAT